MTALMPGAGPPPTRIPIFLGAWLMSAPYHRNARTAIGTLPGLEEME